MAEETYKSWSITGIAESVIREMKEEGAQPDDLEYYLKDAYYSVYSKVPEDAVITPIR